MTSPDPARRTRTGSDADLRLGRRLALAAGVACLFAVPFTLLLVLVKVRWEPLADLDAHVAGDLNDAARANPGMVGVLDVGEVALDPWVFRLAVLGVVAWLWWRGARRLAVWALVTTALGGLLGAVLKVLVERARPVLPEPVAHSPGYSFPSGHALSSLLAVGVLLLVFLPLLGRRGRALAYALGAAVVLFVGFDRVALGVHFVSDVVAGWLVAVAVLAAMTTGFEMWRREEGLRPSAPSEGVEPEAADRLTGPRRPPSSPATDQGRGSVRG